MNEESYKRIFVHVYANNKQLPHSQLLPTTIDVPPFSALEYLSGTCLKIPRRYGY